MMIAIHTPTLKGDPEWVKSNSLIALFQNSSFSPVFLCSGYITSVTVMVHFSSQLDLFWNQLEGKPQGISVKAFSNKVI